MWENSYVCTGLQVVVSSKAFVVKSVWPLKIRMANSSITKKVEKSFKFARNLFSNSISLTELSF